MTSTIRDTYHALIGAGDPAAAFLAGAADVRPDGEPHRGGRPIVVSGPDDLRELRIAVERITGSGTWPFERTEPTGPSQRFTSTIDVDHPAALLRFVVALEDFIHDRAGAWRTWPTVVESVAAALPSQFRLTIDAVVVS